MTAHEIHQHTRPFKVAIKALLRVHLPPLLRVMKLVAQKKNGVVLPEENPAGAGKVLGVIVQERSPLPHDRIIEHILNNSEGYTRRQGHAKDLAGVRAAVALHSKMESVSAWLKNHPNPTRIPMVNGDSTTPAQPEDQEINELLQEAKTLSMVYDRDFVLLFRREVED